MTRRYIIHHGFRYWAEVKTKEELEAEANAFEGWLYLLLAVGLTAFFTIAFFIL